MIIRKTFAIFVCVLGVSVSACHKQGPLEKAGERTDEIVDNVKKGKAPLHKAGPVEKAGQAVDKALNNDKY